MNELVLQKESKMKDFLQDESGFTLVELLAAVVILAIISAISVVAIGQVIQNAREDAGIADIQQAMNAAQLYASTETSGGESGTFNLGTVVGQGYLSTASNTWDDLDAVTFEAQSDGGLIITVPAGSLTAGAKENQPFSGDQQKVLDLDRDTLWNENE